MLLHDRLRTILRAVVIDNELNVGVALCRQLGEQPSQVMRLISGGYEYTQAGKRIGWGHIRPPPAKVGRIQ